MVPAGPQETTAAGPTQTTCNCGCGRVTGASHGWLRLGLRGLDDVGAASVAMVGLAALQAFRDVAHVAPKERVLVNGATGGVGLMLLQLARLRGAHVTAVASAKGVPVERQFGADEVVDYHSCRSADLRERFDVVFDTSSVVKAPFARRQASTRDLAEIARFGRRQRSGPATGGGFDLPDAPRAFERVERGGVIGKVVIRIPDA